MKIVINTSHGGFYISEDFCEYYNIPYTSNGLFCEPEEEISRTDGRLIEYIEKYGSQKASGRHSHLVVKNIPNGTAYRICDGDVREFIEYRDEIDWKIAEG